VRAKDEKLGILSVIVDDDESWVYTKRSTWV
jgi:hypothetical protein